MQRCCILYYSISTVLESVTPFPRIEVQKVCKSQLGMGVESQGLCTWHELFILLLFLSKHDFLKRVTGVSGPTFLLHIYNAQLSKVNKVEITNVLCQVFTFNCSFRNKCKIFGKQDNLLTSAISLPEDPYLRLCFSQNKMFPHFQWGTNQKPKGFDIHCSPRRCICRQSLTFSSSATSTMMYRCMWF